MRLLARSPLFLCSFLAIAISASGAARAMPVFIDFNTLPDGSPAVDGALVGDSYLSLGVSFGTLEAADLLEPRFRQFVPGQNRVRDAGRAPVQEVGFHILATFTTPVSFVSFDTFTASPVDFTVVANALDASGSLIGTVESASIFGTNKGRYSLSRIGPISSVVWSANQPFTALVEIDNLEFIVVPEPGTVATLGLGLLLLTVWGAESWSRRADSNR